MMVFNNCNGTRTQNHLVCKQALNYLAKWLSVRLRTKWLWVWVQLQSLKLQILRLLKQRVPWHSGNYRVWIHSQTRTWHDKNIQSWCFLLSWRWTVVMLKFVVDNLMVNCIVIWHLNLSCLNKDIKESFFFLSIKWKEDSVLHNEVE